MYIEDMVGTIIGGVQWSVKPVKSRSIFGGEQYLSSRVQVVEYYFFSAPIESNVLYCCRSTNILIL